MAGGLLIDLIGIMDAVLNRNFNYIGLTI